MTTFKIIETDWNILENLLDFPIEIFFNIIFGSINNKLLIAENFKTIEDLNSFREEIKTIILSKKDDKKLIEEFLENNTKYINIIPSFDRAIIEEKYPCEIYSDTVYPYLRYFFTSVFPNKKHFISKFNEINLRKEKYPILDMIINNQNIQDKIILMKNLPAINKICNNMIKICSFKYSRIEAKRKIIKNEIIDNKEINNDSLSDFRKIYKNIVLYLKNEKIFNFEEKFDELNEELFLSDLCVDSSEKNYGYILFLIYKEMIKWQNTFIDTLIESKNENIKRYAELFESAIMIQNCKEDQLFKLPNFEDENKAEKKDTNNENLDLMDLIITNSYRKENIIFYNYDEIEEQLESNILPKIKKFKNDIRTVIYQYETFIGNRRGIINDFINRYKQRKLSDEELILVINYIENKKSNFDIKNFLFSFQLLIDIILDYSYEIDKTLFSILNELKGDNFKKYPNIKIINEFFTGIYSKINEENKNDDTLFTIDCLIDLIDIIQLYCWDNIRKNLDKKYLKDIDENIKQKLDNHFEKDNFEKNNYKITKIDFCTAIRIYISRFLSEKNDEIVPKNDLNIYLKNIELWQSNYDIDIIEEEINTIFKDIKVEISQALTIYDYLRGDLKKLDEIISKYKETNKPIDDSKTKIIKEDQPKIDPQNKPEEYIINSHSDKEEEEEEEEED